MKLRRIVFFYHWNKIWHSLAMIIQSHFKSAFPIINGHLETIVPYLFRKASILPYRRERLELTDGDFLDLDWLSGNNSKLVIISHGLEGSSDSVHIRGQAQSLFNHNYDILAWNCRGCSGEVNRLKKSYHSGASQDLKHVVQHAIDRYDQVYLLGHSMGGNITLKYLAEEGDQVSSKIKAAMAISTPLCLASSSKALARGLNTIYTRHFISSLVEKVAQKNKMFNDFNYDLKKIKGFRSFQQFDDLITAPLHEFKDAKDYWNKCSTYKVVHRIACPTLILNAENDPFLEGNCYPIEQVKGIPHIFLEMPKQGGHIGFVQNDRADRYWNEVRTLEFFD